MTVIICDSTYWLLVNLVIRIPVFVPLERCAVPSFRLCFVVIDLRTTNKTTSDPFNRHAHKTNTMLSQCASVYRVQRSSAANEQHSSQQKWSCFRLSKRGEWERSASRSSWKWGEKSWHRGSTVSKCTTKRVFIIAAISRSIRCLWKQSRFWWALRRRWIWLISWVGIIA